MCARSCFKKHLIGLLLGLSLSPPTRATHISSGYIEYTYLAANIYLLRTVLFIPCNNGIGASDSVFVCYSSISGGFSAIAALGLDSVNQAPYDTCLQSNAPLCGAGSWASVAHSRAVYTGVCVLPFSAPDWKFSWTSCCRVTCDNLAAPMNKGFYIESKLANNVYPVNSSPVFTSPMFSFPCVAQPNTIDYGAVDPDGDSLVFELDQAFDYPFTCSPGISGVFIPYVPGYSYLQPIMSSSPVQMNQQTGILSFTPSILQVVLVSLRVREYRNGLLIGSIHRDQIVPVINGYLTGINEVEAYSMQLTCYPNPAADKLIIPVAGAESETIMIFDALGQHVPVPVSMTTEGLSLTLSGITSGLYFVHLNGPLQPSGWFIKQ